MSKIEKPTSICFIGGGGHAVVVAEAAKLQGLQIVGFFDDRASGSLMHYIARWLGTCDDAFSEDVLTPKILAIGDLQLRRKMQRRQTEWTSVFHPTAVVSADSSLGHGGFVSAAAVVSCNAAIGNHAIINTRAIVEHDCVLAENVHIGPGAVLGGGVRVGRDTLIGLNACIKPLVSIGENCIVGAGSVVVDDVSDNQVVVGSPARPVERGKLLRASA